MQGLPVKPSIKERLITLVPISKYQIAEFLCYMRKASFYSNYDRRSIGVKLCTIWYNYRFMKKSLKLGFSIGKDVFGLWFAYTLLWYYSAECHSKNW